MFYIAGKKGFVTDEGDCDANVRWAKPFESFSDADNYAKEHPKQIDSYYAVLTTATPEAA